MARSLSILTSPGQMEAAAVRRVDPRHDPTPLAFE